MKIWAISDLHLAFAQPAPRDQFGARWRDHANRLEQQWRQAVARDDVVLLPGDLSAAANHRDLQPDLAWIARLPGTKVLAPGNHDRWWNSTVAVSRMMRPGMHAVDGTAVRLEDLIICGARSAEAHDEAKLKTALLRLRAALEAAAALRIGDAPSRLAVLWHHPPFDAYGRPGPAVELIEAAGADLCVFGHLHRESQWASAKQGLVGRVRYYCVAADALAFRPLGVG